MSDVIVGIFSVRRNELSPTMSHEVQTPVLKFSTNLIQTQQDSSRELVDHILRLGG